MQDHYLLLQTIYEIAKNDPQPERYPCRPRELILRSLLEWSVIQQQLQLLESEEMVITKQKETLIIHITNTGMEKVKAQDDLVSREA
jgi:predicted transcriptional regulator